MSNAPELRFLGFSEAWKHVPLSSLVSFHNSGIYKSKDLKGSGNNIVGVSHLFSIQAVDGQEFDRVPLTETEQADYTLQEGDLLYAESSLVRGGIAKCVYVTAKGQGTAFAWHTRRFRVNPEICISAFVYYFLESPVGRSRIEPLATQTALTGITTKDYFSVSIPVVPISEQQKIASFLSSVDKKIDLMRQKKDSLELYKKGLMQKIFSQEIRFKQDDGSDFPEWEEVALGDVGEFENNRREPITKSKRKPGEFPYYGASGIVDYVDHYNFDETRLLLGEDGAKWAAYEGTAFIASGKYCVNNHAHVISMERDTMMIVKDMLYQMNISKWVTGAAPPKLTLDNAKSIRLCLPTSSLERSKIANFLVFIDEKLLALSNSISEMETFKKGLLQQMFV